MTCTVSGLVYAPDGTPLQNTLVVFKGADVVPEYDKVAVPVSVTVTTDETGALEVDLYPGSYECMARASAEAYQFSIAVPNQATADLEDLIDGMVLYVGIPVLNAFAQLGNSTGAQQVLGSVGIGGYAWKTFDFTDRDAMVAYDSSNHNDGDVFWAGDVAHVYEDGADVYPDKANLKPLGAIYPDHFGRNTTPGTTDMTSAIDAADTYAASVGQPLVFRRGHTYGYDGGVVHADWIGGGKIICNAGETGNFVTTGADGLFFDVEFDQNFEGISGNSCFFINGHDNVSTGDNFVARNAQFNCVRVVDANNARLRGRAFDSYNKCVLVKAATQDVTGLDIDMTVDTTAIGLLNVHGAVSIQGTEGAGWDEDARDPDDIDCGVLQPRISVRAFMLESEDWDYEGESGVCLELRRGIFGGHVDAVVTGGSLGYSINDSYGTVCQIATTGARNVGIEANGPHNSVITATCKVSHVTGIGPDQGMQLSKANNVQIHGAFEHRYGDDTYPAPLFIHRCNDSHVIASVVADTGGTNSMFARVHRSPNTTLELIAEGAGVDYAVLVDDRNTGENAPSTGLALKGCKFPATTNLIYMPGTSMTLDDVRVIGGTVAAPTGDVVANATVTNMQVSLDSDIGDLDATYFATAPDHVEFMDYREGEASQFRAWGDGSPIGQVAGRAGSVWFDTTNGLVYHKTGNTGSADWAELLGRNSDNEVAGQVHFTNDSGTGTVIFGPDSGGTTNANARLVRTDTVVNWAAYSAGGLKARVQMNLGNGVNYYDAESNHVFRDRNGGAPVTLATVKTTGRIDTTGGYEIGGTAVLTGKMDFIADVPTGGSATAADNAEAINDLLAALKGASLMATS